MNHGPNDNRTDSRPIDRMAAFHDDRVTIPDEFRDASQLVVRTPWYTLVHQRRAYTYYNSENDHLKEGEISFARFGGEEIVYELDGYDVATDGGEPYQVGLGDPDAD